MLIVRNLVFTLKIEYFMDRHSLWKSLDHFKRKQFLKYEIKQLFLKSIKVNRYTSYSLRYKAVFYQSKFFKNKSRNKVKNLCIDSGRVKSVYKKTYFSRFRLRSHLYESNLPGFKRASW
jgi:ribosomal protein S14